MHETIDSVTRARHGIQTLRGVVCLVDFFLNLDRRPVDLREAMMTDDYAKKQRFAIDKFHKQINLIY